MSRISYFACIEMRYYSLDTNIYRTQLLAMPVPNSLNYKVTKRGISIMESVFDICPLSNSLSIVLVLFFL